MPNPVSPVYNTSLTSFEVVLGKDQPQYIQLPALAIPDLPASPMITRWRLTVAELQKIMDGADIVLTVLTFKQPFQPVHLQICGQDETPEIVTA
jgi:hypothetical protein